MPPKPTHPDLAAQVQHLDPEAHYLKKELYALIQSDPSIFDFLQNGSLDGIWYWDLEKPEIEWMSDRFWTLLGHDPRDKEHLAAEWQDIIHPDDRQVALENFNKHCEDPAHLYDQVVRYRHKDGSTVWVRCRGIAIRDETGKPMRMLGAHTDLTLQKKTEASLKENEQKYRQLFETALVGIYRTRIEDGKFLAANESLARMMGYDSVDEFIAEFITSEHYTDRRRREELIEKLEQDGFVEGYEIEVARKDGTPINIALSAILYPDQGYSEGVIIDITARKQMEQQLANSERYYREIFGATSDAVFIHDMQGRILDVNRTVSEMFGMTREEALNCTAEDLSQGEPPYTQQDAAKYIQKGIEEGPQLFEWRSRRKNGVLFWTEVKLELTTIDEQKRIVVVARDIIHRKEAEQALADSEQRLADIIEFLPDPTWVIDTQGRVVAWNRAMERLSGVSKQNMLGKGNHAHAVPFYGIPRPLLIDLVLKGDPKWESTYLSFRDEGDIMASESFNPLMGEGGSYLAGSAARLYNTRGEAIGAIESIRDVTAAKKSEKERERLIGELQAALSEVRVLSGLLPICSSCKKIRDDGGYWNQIESYIRDHSEAQFSHSICPECARELYPDLEYPE